MPVLDHAEKEQAVEGAGPTPSAPTEERVGFLTLMRNRPFRNLFFGQFISQIGDYFAFLAITVVVASFSTENSETTREVSGVMIAIGLPRLIFGVLAGVFVDRWDRRITMLVSDLIRPAITLLLIPAFLMQNLWMIYVLAFLLSAVGTFFIPAKGALIPNMVPAEHLTAANAFTQTSVMMAFFVGPALAGGTFALVGEGNMWVAFVVDAVSFLVSGLMIWLIRMPKEATQVSLRTQEDAGTASNRSEVGKVWAELMVGLKALVLNRAMSVLALVFGITMLGIGALNVLWVVFLRSAFGFQTTELAWRFAVIDIAFFAGMAAASVLVGSFLNKLAPKLFIVWGLILAGVTTLPIGFLPDYWLVVAAMLLVGLTVAPINTGVTTLMQIVVPNSQLGRVGGGIATVSETANITSMALAGVLGSILGIPLVFFISGVLLVLAGALGHFGLPNVTLKDKPEEETAPEPLQVSPKLPEQQVA
jgi:MFS transporter, DHA3 family, macrolide efflux protein